MRSSQKPSKGKRRGKEAIPDSLVTQSDRLRQALMLGIRFDTREERKWLSSDFMISSRAVKMMSGFIDHISPKLLHHNMIKESVGDMLVALEGILQIENETVLNSAVIVSMKLFKCLGHSLFEYRSCGVISCLSHLLSSHQLAIVTSSAKALNSVLKNVDSSRRYMKEISLIFKKHNTTTCIMDSLHGYEVGVQSIEFFLELVSLLKAIALIWPIARYSIWNRAEVMEKLGQLCAALDLSVTTHVLQLYCAISLCNDVALSFVESKQPFISNLVLCMESSVPLDIRIEAFRLCQQLVRSEDVCLSLTSLCGEEIVQRITEVLGGGALVVSSEQVLLLKEACSAAKMTRWIGNHQSYFWKQGISKILFDLLGQYGKIGEYQSVSKHMKLRGDMHHIFPDITSSIWTVLQWLSMNCVEENFFSVAANLSHLNDLISCTCSLMVDGLLKERQFCCSPDKSFTLSMLLPLFRATLSMVFSPCKTIASQTLCCLDEILSHDNFRDCLQYTLERLTHYANEQYSETLDNDLLLRHLIVLACYSSLSERQCEIIQKGGVNILLIMLKSWQRRESHLKSIALSHGHCHCHAVDKTRELEDTFLLYILQALSCLIPVSSRVVHHPNSEKVFMTKNDDTHGESVLDSLLGILETNCSREIKWYSAYCLSFFGYFGFPSRIGRRMKMAFDDTKWKDSQLILSDKNVIGVHHVILVCRCPSLLPPPDSNADKNSAHVCSERLASIRCLSSHVKRSTLEKILEFVYTGFVQVEEDDVPSSKILAKSCGLKSLYRMLQRKIPLYSSLPPVYDLTSALTPLGHVSSDVILEAEETKAVQNCSMCNLLIPHIHAHRIILCSNSEYFRALFHSEMQESSTKNIKVPLPWLALVKLLHWFYSGELPAVKFGCKWTCMDQQLQLDELLVYMKISELAEIWLLDEVRQKSLDIVISCLKQNKRFPIKIVQFAYELRQYEILEIALNSLVPSYNQLHESGVLGELDEILVEMLREKYVLCSLEVHGATD